jgi:hypothetical protein
MRTQLLAFLAGAILFGGYGYTQILEDYNDFLTALLNP